MGNTKKQEPMNTQLINQIKALQGVKEVTMVNDMAVVFEPREPILHDEYGVPLYENDPYWWVNTEKSAYNNLFVVNTPEINISIGIRFPASSKIFSTHESAQKWIDEQKKPKPIYTDPEDGTEFFEGDNCWWFIKKDYSTRHINIVFCDEYEESTSSSKIYKSRQLCELALAKFLMNKYK